MFTKETFRAGVVLDGRYRTLEFVHTGSFGAVFRARDLKTRTIVAIKALRKPSQEEIDSPDYVDNRIELFLHERLGQHPSIVRLLSSFDTDTHLYIVLENCEDGDLWDNLKAAKDDIATDEVRRMLLELIDAVEHAHSKGVYHRDIKPENVFLHRNGRIKLGDWGLATSDAWSYENSVGSDRYMAPEQFESAGAGYSPAQADIWSVGICLLNMLWLKYPFKKPTTECRVFRDFSTDAKSLFDIFPNMSQDTFEVVQHLLSLDPTKRSLKTARTLLQGLRRFTASYDDEDDRAAPQAIPSKIPFGSLKEDVFARSGESDGWCSAATVQSNSFASTHVSGVGLSVPQVSALRPTANGNRLPKKLSTIAGSMPITISQREPKMDISLIFASSAGASKSWADIDEEAREEEAMLENTDDIDVFTKVDHFDHVDEAIHEANDSGDDLFAFEPHSPKKSTAYVPPHKRSTPSKPERDHAKVDYSKVDHAKIKRDWGSFGKWRRANHDNLENKTAAFAANTTNPFDHHSPHPRPQAQPQAPAPAPAPTQGSNHHYNHQPSDGLYMSDALLFPMSQVRPEHHTDVFPRGFNPNADLHHRGDGPQCRDSPNFRRRGNTYFGWGGRPSAIKLAAVS